MVYFTVYRLQTVPMGLVTKVARALGSLVLSCDESPLNMKIYAETSRHLFLLPSTITLSQHLSNDAVIAVVIIQRLLE